MKLIVIVFISTIIISSLHGQSLWNSNYPVFTKDFSITDSLESQLIKLQYNENTQGKINSFPCNVKNRKVSILAKIIVPVLNRKNHRLFELYLLKIKNGQNDTNIFYTSDQSSHKYIDCFSYKPLVKELKSIQAITTDMTDDQIEIQFFEDKSTSDSLIINENHISINEEGHFYNEFTTPAYYSVFKRLEDKCPICGTYMYDSAGISIKLVIKQRKNTSSFAYEYSINSAKQCGTAKLNLNAIFINDEVKIDSFTTIKHLKDKLSIYLDNYKLDCDDSLIGNFMLDKID